MPSSASAGKIVALGAAAHQRVLDLQVADRVHLRGAADRLDADLGEADVADVARLHHVGDRADGLLDRDRGIEARRTVDVDVVDAEARQAVGEEVLRRGGARVEAEVGAVGAAQGAELHAEQGPVAAGAGERLADEELVLAHRIEVARVDEVHAALERGVDRGDALRLVAAAVQAAGAHAHAAERDRKHLGARGAELGRCFGRRGLHGLECGPGRHMQSSE